MALRETETVEYLRRTFTDAERLQMGNRLAEAYNGLATLDEEEASMKAKIKERRSTLEATVGSLSRELGTGWTMENVKCRLDYDTPNPFEVSYVRIDTGEIVKTRPMTDQERQAEIPFDKPQDQPIEDSQAAIEGFFGTQTATATDQPKPITEKESEDDDAENTEDVPGEDDEQMDPSHDAEYEGVGGKEEPKRLRGFSRTTNRSVN